MAQILSGITSALRPMAKELIKGGLLAMDAISEYLAETGEQVKDLVAEAKAELAHEDKDEKTTMAQGGQKNGVQT
jgi:uncharacterized protein DUF5132